MHWGFKIQFKILYIASKLNLLFNIESCNKYSIFKGLQPSTFCNYWTSVSYYMLPKTHNVYYEFQVAYFKVA